MGFTFPAFPCKHPAMDYPLQFGKQTWKPRHDGELTVFLPSHPRYEGRGTDRLFAE